MTYSSVEALMYCKALSMLGNYLRRINIFSRRRKQHVPEVFALIRAVSRA